MEEFTMATLTKTVTSPCTWAEIKKGIVEGCANELFKVGDEITDTLTTGKEVDFVVAGIDIYARNQVVFSLKNALKDKHSMNSEWTNKGGWLESEMREYINSKMIETFPADLREIITPRVLHSGKKSGEDKL
jgi:hypothetical protein